jgi:hypothetical protein
MYEYVRFENAGQGLLVGFSYIQNQNFVVQTEAKKWPTHSSPPKNIQKKLSSGSYVTLGK